MSFRAKPSVDAAIRTEVLYADRLVPCYAHRPMNLDDMLARSVAKWADAPAIEDGDTTLSYRHLDRDVNRVAAGLRTCGISAGDRVALFVGNRAEFIVVLFGIWRLGAIAVPIGTRQSATELAYMLNQCTAAALIFDAALTERLPSERAIASVRLKVRIDEVGQSSDTSCDKAFTSYAALMAAGNDDRLVPAIDDQVPACIMYTSGTTGNPKGAMLSHLGFFHTAHHYERRLGYQASDRMLLVIPASHISGLLAVIVTMMLVGGCVICLRQFQASETLATIEARRITAAVMVPAMYNLCLLQPDIDTRDLSCWRIGHFGGAAMPEVTIQRLVRAIPNLSLYNGFGATETTSAVTLTEDGDAARFPDSVGTLVDCVDIRVLNEHGQEVAQGEAGELWIRSPGNAIGYWDNPGATRDAFVAGYWRSGDVGSVDEHGYLRVFDRIKDMLNRGGFKVYCVELENVIQRFPGVIEVAAVASPCGVLGERIHVFVHATDVIDSDALRKFCRDALADYKTPDFITVSSTPLPRNLNGKLVKAPLREVALHEAQQRLISKASA